MPEPTRRGWRSCGRWESISAASDADSGLTATAGTSVGGPLASPGRHRRVLRARLLVRILDGPHTAAETAPRPQRRPARTRPARGPHRLGPGLGGGCPHPDESRQRADGAPGPARLLRLGTIHRAHRFVRNLLRRLLALGLVPGNARRVDEHSSDRSRAVLRPGADARFPWLV